jgi:hypothetical protein
MYWKERNREFLEINIYNPALQTRREPIRGIPCSIPFSSCLPNPDAIEAREGANEIPGMIVAVDLDFSHAGVGEDVGFDGAGTHGGWDGVARKVDKEVAVGAGERAGGGEGVDDAGAAKVSAAGTGGGGGGYKDLARCRVGEDGGRDGLENVALDQGVGARGDIESVARVGVPVVVEGVPDRVKLELWRTARGVVDVVAIEGDQVVVTVAENGPVVTAIAGGGPAGLTIEFVVGNGHTAGGIVARDEELTADKGEFVMVDPNLVGPIKGDGISTPDVFWVL